MPAGARDGFRPVIAGLLAIGLVAAGPGEAIAAPGDVAASADAPAPRDPWSRARPWLVAGLTGGPSIVLLAMAYPTMHVDPPAFYVAPATMGLGHLLRGDLGRAAATSLGGPLAGLAGGAAGGLGAILLSSPDVGMAARYGYLAGAVGFGGWATWDAFRQADLDPVAVGAPGPGAEPSPAPAPVPAGPSPDPRLAMAIPAGAMVGLGLAAVPTGGLALVGLPLTLGLGHVYAGDPVRGALVTAGGPLAGAVGAVAITSLALAANAGQPSGTPAVITGMPIGFVLGYGVYTVWAVLDAGWTAAAKAPAPASPAP